MADRLWFLIPELILLAGAVVCAIGGLSNVAALRRRIGFVASLFLVAACVVTPWIYTAERVAFSTALYPTIGYYIKFFVPLIGILLVMTSGGLIDRRYEHAIAKGKDRFHALRTSGGEYHALLLLSITGLMLLCEATDLIWLFLALELVSLPTYVMVAISRWSYNLPQSLNFRKLGLIVKPDGWGSENVEKQRKTGFFVFFDLPPFLREWSTRKTFLNKLVFPTYMNNFGFGKVL